MPTCSTLDPFKNVLQTAALRNLSKRLASNQHQELLPTLPATKQQQLQELSKIFTNSDAKAEVKPNKQESTSVPKINVENKSEASIGNPDKATPKHSNKTNDQWKES